MPAPAERSESPKTPPKFDLGAFVVLPENWSAVRAVRSVVRAASLGKRAPMSPLVLHGPPGCGKSHLCRAALAALMRASPGIVVRSESAGDLARPDVLAEGSGFGDRGLFTCDALVLEDVQHLPERAADGVCELLDHRTRHRAATVVTTALSPAELAALPKRLTSRLVAGLTVRLDPLGVAGRRKVLAAAAQSRNVRLTPDALEWLANRVGGLRPALGALQNLAQVASNYPGPLDAATVERTLAETGQPTSGSASVDAIIKRVIAAFGITERALLGPSRLRNVLVPRQVAMYLARELVGLSLPRIGAAFGRDHTTVLHACRKIEDAVKQDAALDSRVRQLRGELG